MPSEFQKLKAEHDRQLYDIYVVQAKTTNRLLGGWPKNPIEELSLLKARMNKGLIKEETYQAAVDAVQQASSNSAEVETEQAKLRAWTVFFADDAGIYFASRQIKAAIKECASVLGLLNDLRGTKQILQHALFAYATEGDREKIRFYREPLQAETRTLVTAADGYEQLIAHVIGPQGPRSTIKHHDYVEDVYFEFEMRVRDYKDRVTLKKFLTPCLLLMQDNGIGCSRSQGYGRLEILECETKQTAVMAARKKKDKKDPKEQ